MTATIRDVKEQHQNRLLAIEGVVSVGIGKNEDGEHCIVVGIENDGAREKIPATIDGYPVFIKKTGQIKTH